MTEEIDDGLTDEERAALAEDDAPEETTNEDAGEGAGDNDGEGAESSEAEGDSGTEAKPEPAADAAKPEPTADTPAPAETQQQQAPILVAPVPADVEAKLAEITTQKNDLLDKFDNGDITAKEYQQQIDALAKAERQIERQQDRAELAAAMEQQRLQNEWARTCNEFVERNAIYKDNVRLYKALDAEVRDLANKPETANWSGQRFLEEAHKNLAAAFGLKDAAPKAEGRPTRPARELPPNLAKVPAADVEDTNGGRFAVLDRMASTDPLALEEAMAKMPESEVNAYLAS